MRVICTIFNDTGISIRCKGGNGRNIIIPIGGKYLIEYDCNETYREYSCISAVDERLLGTFNSDEFSDCSEVRIYLESKKSSASFDFKRRSANSVGHAFKAAKDNISLKINAALGSCTDLKELLATVRLCRNQCDHLVQTYREGIHKMKQLHSKLAKDPEWMWDFYKAGRLTQLFNSLDSLEYIVCDVKDLLGACAKELGRIALVVSSMPMPPDDQKDKQVCSKFDLLVGELLWSFDLIEYELQPEGDVKLEWCLTQRRYVLNWIDGSKNSVAKVKSAVTIPDTVGDVRSRARMDREDLLSDGSGSIFVLDICVDIPTGLKSWYEQPFKQLRKLLFGKTHSEVKGKHQSLLRGQRELDILRDIIVKRCKVEMHIKQNSSRNLRSLSVDLECFRISHLDLKLRKSRVLGSGAFKNIYEGARCGQRVAIATIRDFDLEELENEVKQLIGLQHPKVVSFYGWAYTEDAPPPIKTPEEDKDNLKCQGYYIVTEKMECDLEDLINGIRRAATIKRLRRSVFTFCRTGYLATNRRGHASCAQA